MRPLISCRELTGSRPKNEETRRFTGSNPQNRTPSEEILRAHRWLHPTKCKGSTRHSCLTTGRTKKGSEHQPNLRQLLFQAITVGLYHGSPRRPDRSTIPIEYHLIAVRHTGALGIFRRSGEKSCGCVRDAFGYPIGSMYGIYANMWGILMVNVTIYGIHGSYGYG